MLESIIYLSPLIVLLSAIFILLFSEHGEEEYYHCFRFSRIMMLLAFALTVIFYNKPLVPDLTHGSHYTLLFESLLYCGSFALLYLSRKWFASMNISGYVFCGSMFMTLLFGSLLIRSTDMLLSAVCCVFIMVADYILLRAAGTKREASGSDNVFMISSIFSAGLLLFSLATFYPFTVSFNYADLRLVLAGYSHQQWLYVGVCGINLSLMFMIALAPLHFWFTETLGKAILPVFAYFIIVPVSACWGALIRLNVEVFPPLADNLFIFYKVVALSSISLGALGACSGQNVRKILAYGTVFHWGIIFLVMQGFSLNAVNAGLIYMLVYLLAMFGICACLFGLKIKGEYLVTLSDFAGAAYKRPYISAMMAVFIFSLLGLPPFLGFFGVFSALSYLAKHDSFYQFGYVLLMMTVLSYAYLQIIKSLYFEKSEESFDRSDTGIYVAVFINAMLMIIIMLKPHYLMQDVSLMIESIFQ